MVVVMLSNAADITNVMPASSHTKAVLLCVVICRVMMSKPPCRSIKSTIVMAPIRKTRISQAEPKAEVISAPTVSEDCPAKRMNIDHSAPHIRSAIADLLMRIHCSEAINE